jgi:hypothetical protein
MEQLTHLLQPLALVPAAAVMVVLDVQGVKADRCEIDQQEQTLAISTLDTDGLICRLFR